MYIQKLILWQKLRGGNGRSCTNFQLKRVIIFVFQKQRELAVYFTRFI